MVLVKRVISPYRKQRIGVPGVVDAMHDSTGRDRSLGGSESSVGGFGDLGIGGPRSGSRTAPGYFAGGGASSVTGRARYPGGDDGLGDHQTCTFARAGFPAQSDASDDRRGVRRADRRRQRGHAFAQDLFAGDFRVSVGGALFGVALARAQQRVEVNHLGFDAASFLEEDAHHVQALPRRAA